MRSPLRATTDRRIVIKAVNYRGKPQHPARSPARQRCSRARHCDLTYHHRKAFDQASLENPDVMAPVSRPFAYTRDLAIDLDSYTVAVLEIHTA